jgi:hypothetical protein
MLPGHFASEDFWKMTLPTLPLLATLLPMHTIFLQRFSIIENKVVANTCNKLEKRKRAKWEREKSGRDSGIITLL